MLLSSIGVYADGICAEKDAIEWHHVQRVLFAEVECSKEIFGNTKAIGATLMLKISFPQSTPACYRTS
jgi:hypothetical protein